MPFKNSEMSSSNQNHSHNNDNNNSIDPASLESSTNFSMNNSTNPAPAPAPQVAAPTMSIPSENQYKNYISENLKKKKYVYRNIILENDANNDRILTEHAPLAIDQDNNVFFRELIIYLCDSNLIQQGSSIFFFDIERQVFVHQGREPIPYSAMIPLKKFAKDEIKIKYRPQDTRSAAAASMMSSRQNNSMIIPSNMPVNMSQDFSRFRSYNNNFQTSTMSSYAQNSSYREQFSHSSSEMLWFSGKSMQSANNNNNQLDSSRAQAASAADAEDMTSQIDEEQDMTTAVAAAAAAAAAAEAKSIPREKRVKERKIGYVRERVREWRRYYEEGVANEQGILVKVNLDIAAGIIGLSRKTLDDYYKYIRKAEQFNFDFERGKDEKIGVLRNFVRDRQKRQSTSTAASQSLSLNQQQSQSSSAASQEISSHLNTMYNGSTSSSLPIQASSNHQSIDGNHLNYLNHFATSSQFFSSITKNKMVIGGEPMQQQQQQQLIIDEEYDEVDDDENPADDEDIQNQTHEIPAAVPRRVQVEDEEINQIPAAVPRRNTVEQSKQIQKAAERASRQMAECNPSDSSKYQFPRSKRFTLRPSSPVSLHGQQQSEQRLQQNQHQQQSQQHLNAAHPNASQSTYANPCGPIPVPVEEEEEFLHQTMMMPGFFGEHAFEEVEQNEINQYKLDQQYSQQQQEFENIRSTRSIHKNEDQMQLSQEHYSHAQQQQLQQQQSYYLNQYQQEQYQTYHHSTQQHRLPSRRCFESDEECKDMEAIRPIDSAMFESQQFQQQLPSQNRLNSSNHSFDFSVTPTLMRNHSIGLCNDTAHFQEAIPSSGGHHHHHHYNNNNHVSGSASPPPAEPDVEFNHNNSVDFDEEFHEAQGNCTRFTSTDYSHY